MSILKKAQPPLSEKFQTFIAKAERELAAAKQAAADAILANGHADSDEVTIVATLKNKLEMFHISLEQALEKEAREERKQRALQREKAWDATEKLLRQREDISIEIETSVLRLADYWKELTSLNKEIFDACPDRIGSQHSSGLSVEAQEAAFRLYMRKQGFRFAADYPWNVDDIEPFSKQTKLTNRALRDLRKLRDHQQDEVAA
ncbi:MAG: hypothetical protein HOK11_03280 [Rhodospirillaceae bacterium]|jgi:hypothetical protein|nr:hypothetical protein [Rhodospirillaceae bacterium]